MKFDLFLNLRPTGDTVAAATWVKFTPLNGETDCSTCVTQNLKEKLVTKLKFWVNKAWKLSIDDIN